MLQFNIYTVANLLNSLYNSSYYLVFLQYFCLNFLVCHVILATKSKRGSGRPLVLVMAPTRELACQTETEAIKFGRPLGLRYVLLH